MRILTFMLLAPLLFAGCSITAALGIVYLLAHAVLMVAYVPNPGERGPYKGENPKSETPENPQP